MEQELFTVTVYVPGISAGKTEGQQLTREQADERYQWWSGYAKAVLGHINRVTVTDSKSEIVAEWLFSAGHVFPLPPYNTTPIETSVVSH